MPGPDKIASLRPSLGVRIAILGAILSLLAAVAGCSFSLSDPVDYDKYRTLTCGEWLAASEEEQNTWAHFDWSMTLGQATTDIAKESIESFSVNQWADGIRDACQKRDPDSAVFPPG